MSNLKKTAVAILALSSSAAFAGTMGPVCVPGNVTVPCETTAWDFGAQALWLNPTIAGDLTYFNPYQSTTGYDVYNNRGNKFKWGFQIEGSYHYGTGNDIDVAWYHLNGAWDKSFYSTEYDTAAVPVAHTATNNTVTHPNWDQVNVEFAQHMDFSETSKARFHEGIEYARVAANGADNMSFTNTGTTINGLTYTAGTLNYQESWNSSFNGFGPRGGLDLSYVFGNGVSIYGKAAASLLIGHTNWSGAKVGNQVGRRINFNTECWSGSSTRLVPELEGKLGATYTWAMSYGDVTFDIGYLWLNYFNALDGRHEDNDAFNETITGGRSDKRGINDFALDGLYFGLKWLGNVA